MARYGWRSRSGHGRRDNRARTGSSPGLGLCHCRCSQQRASAHSAKAVVLRIFIAAASAAHIPPIPVYSLRYLEPSMQYQRRVCNPIHRRKGFRYYGEELESHCSRLEQTVYRFLTLCRAGPDCPADKSLCRVAKSSSEGTAHESPVRR